MSSEHRHRSTKAAPSVDTRAIHSGQEPDAAYGAVAAPIYQTSTFAFDSPGQGARRFAGEERGYIYSRLGNPTTVRLEECVAALEEGSAAIAMATGMAAISGVFLGLLEAGQHVVCSDCVYGPTRLLLERDLARFGIASTFVDTTDLEQVAAAFRPETRMLFVETPANPTLKITDLAAAAQLAHDRRARLAVDSTFASPVLQRPLTLGADVVVHSTTKYINGHADVVGGILVVGDDDLHRRLVAARSSFGGSMDPHQSWLVLRGVKTLPLRVRQAQENAGRLANLLVEHPAVAKVRYPGLPDHPQHELARRQMDGFGSMISFELVGGREAGARLLESVRLMILAVSLGGVETLIEHPASMTHAGLSLDELEGAGIGAGLVRLAVGCEGIDDLAADLRQALDQLV
jgi:methionine-gamma-lyase